MTKTCKECGKLFTAKTSALYCSDECRKIVKRRHNKEYRENNREYLRLYQKNLRLRKKGGKAWAIEESKAMKERIACEEAHDHCFSCPTEDGECLFEL